ncbi:Rv0361 family membrane protein [Micromonospora okii]|uniref:Rv0361 family membrane protein n=1 Tax=Micromonospora okii TaxID=1182970 RepID=UPI001E3E3E4C|nr:hypothetical protein [Micromonospora okii]
MTHPPSGGATGSPSGPTSGGPTGPLAPGAVPPVTHPHPAPASPARRRRGGLIAVVVAVAALLLCGGGGTAAFLALRDAETGEGAREPTVAVESFLTAVYEERDARKAGGLVCAAARDDKKITAKVAELKRYAEQHRDARFRWSEPQVDERTGKRATVSTKVTMTTSDEKTAEQDLRFTVVRTTGWWVCEVA